MKKIIFTILMVISSISYADDKTFGLGVIIGAPTGISANYYTAEDRSIDFALAYNFSGDNEFYIHSDYLFYSPNGLLSNKDFGIGWYTGVGGRLRIENNVSEDDKFRLGVRGVIGANLELKRAPIEIFAEIVPIIDIINKTDLDLNGGLGLRYYF